MKYEEVSSVYTLKKNHKVILEGNWLNLSNNYGKILNIYKDKKSRLEIIKGFSWDGSTGAKDCKEDMEASLVHDWLCYTIDLEYGTDKKNWKKYRKMADKEYLHFLKKNGLQSFRAYLRYFAIRRFAFFKALKIK